MQPEELRTITSTTTDGVWALARPHTGEQYDVQPTDAGNVSDVTALVKCEKGQFFVKAMRNRPGGRLSSLLREAAVNTSVRAVTPQLLWRIEDDDWVALGFEVIDARRSSFKPGSKDLPHVTRLVHDFAELPVPAEAAEWAETRWNRFADDPSLLAGKSLLFTDIHESNLLIGNGRTWAVDWSWPTVGAPFIDPACLAVQLIAAGHHPADAEWWAGQCRAWRDADPSGLDAFAVANARMHRTFADKNPDAPWIDAMATAAEAWAEHRGVTVSTAEA